MTNIRLKFLFILIFTSIVNALPVNNEFRATWVITWEFISPSQNSEETMARIDQIMDNHSLANMTAVFFQVRQSGTSYYDSTYEPWGYYTGYTDPGFDPLEYAIEAAHNRGLELHAWFNVFQASSMHDGAPAQVHPEWVCRDRDGEPMTSNRSLSPGLESVRNYTIEVAMEIVNNYDIDGLHLDYVRWNEYSNNSLLNLPEGQIEEIRMIDGIISDETLEQLEDTRTGRYLYDIDHPYSAGIPDNFSSWEEWWRSGVTTFVSTLHDSIQSVKPYVRLSAAVLGRYNWGGWQGYGTVYQDGALWLNEGFVDQLTPMHYHWTTPNSFVQMLSGSNESWSPYIQQGIDEGRLFTAGPGSYVLADQNLWDNHNGIVNAVRNIQFIDGFQFFSNGTWEDYQYWEEAGHTFFKKKSIVRNIPEYENNSEIPPEPNITLNQINELEYQISISTNSQDSHVWTLVSLIPSDSIDIPPEIYSTHFASEDITVPLSFDGLQLYEGTYNVLIQNFNRFWVGSENIADATTDIIPSYPPVLVDLNIEQNDTVAANTVIRFEFSKKMDQSSFQSAFSLFPEPDSLIIEWSEYWLDAGKAVSIYFPGLLEFDTEYSLEISSDLTDIIGIQFDGNMDGIPGDGVSLSFHTEPTDLTGPEVINIYPLSNHIFDTEGVFNVQFDEIIDISTLSDMSLYFFSDELSLTTDHIENTIDEKTTVSIKPFAPLLNNATCSIILDGLTDTLGNPISEILEYSYNTSDFYYSEKSYIDRFNTGAGWWQPDGSGSTTGIIGSETQFNYSNSVFVPGVSMTNNGRKSGSLRYAWDTDASTSFLRLHNGGSPSEIPLTTSDVIQVYVYSDGSRNQFTISLYEYINGALSSDVIEVMSWKELNWTGWKLIEWDLSDPEQIGSWLSNDQMMNGDEYFLDGFLIKPGENSEDNGRIYFDDLRIVTKSNGSPPENSAPIISFIPDTTIEDGTNFFFYVNFSDNDEYDIHHITISTDTTAVVGTVYGHTSGSVINIDYEPFIGTSTITVIVNDFGLGELSDTTQFSLTIDNDLLAKSNLIPKKFKINRLYPNPFNPIININFDIDNPRNVSMSIVDITGREIKNILKNKLMNTGNFNQQWDGRNNMGELVATGIYIIRISSEHQVLRRKITYVK